MSWLSTLGEEAETGEGCREVRQHPAASHLSGHLCYASHGIQSEACGRQSWMLTTKPHNLPPYLITLNLNPMWINKRAGIPVPTLTFIQVQICTNKRRRSGDEELRCGVGITEVFTTAKCWRLIFTALFARTPCVQSFHGNRLGSIHLHAFFALHLYIYTYIFMSGYLL